MRSLLLPMLAVCAIGCDGGAASGPMYYDRVIQPIFNASCVRNQGFCHKDDGQGNALGNLDLTSYENVNLRRDVLRVYGSFPIPLLLLKGSAGAGALPPIPYQGRTSQAVYLPSQIQHVGGATIDVQSNAFLELQRWMERGAQRDGSLAIRPKQTGTGACRSDFVRVRPDVAAQLSTVDVRSQAFRDFAANIEPMVARNCAFSTCHSAELSDLFFTCQGSGSDDASKFNFLEAQAFLASPPETSQLVLKPLAPSAGGLSHTGGIFFASKNDVTWKNLLAWATEAGVSSQLSTLSDGQKFFIDRVMPVLLQRGCALESCHSPGSPNDFKLRAGSQGFFSASALLRNYDVARYDFLVPDVPDVRQSRLVKKPVVLATQGGVGIAHRGGPPLQSPGETIDPQSCPQPWTPSSTAFCTIVEWHRIERAALLATQAADVMAPATRLPLVAVMRPPNADRLIDFDTYRGGADLVAGSVAVGALGAINPASGTVTGTLLDVCLGGPRPDVDVRGPEVSYDGSRVVFAMRVGAADTLDVYELTLADHRCSKLTDGNGRSQNGILLHNLDPVYAPDGSIIFASTRGRPGIGPTRSLKYLLPQTDLWRLPRMSGSYGAPQQMTTLLGSDLSPAMMANGQVSFTTEKTSQGFYQLSGRRINWDLTDYHPLLGQRSQSPGLDGQMHPSVDYSQATEIREGVDRNFVLVLSDEGAAGAGGTLAFFNRSIGPFEADRSDVTFLRAVTVIDPAATGRAGPTQGAYRSPFPLPDGRLLTSYAPAATDLSTMAPVRYDLVVLDPKTGMRAQVAGFSGGTSSWVEPVLVYRREPRPLFNNVTQLIFGGQVDASDPQHGTVHYPDLPLLSTLLGANLRTGRFVSKYRPAVKVVVYEDQAPPASMTTPSPGQTYQNRRKLGEAALAPDGSVQLRLPAMTPVILELVDRNNMALFTMTEEDQLGPGEHIARGVPQSFFNSVCGGCHGSVSGRELDIGINPDALTQASVSLSRDPSKTVTMP